MQFCISYISIYLCTLFLKTFQQRDECIVYFSKLTTILFVWCLSIPELQPLHFSIDFSIRIDGKNGSGLIIKCEDCEAKYLYLSGYMLYCVQKENPIWKHAALIQYQCVLLQICGNVKQKDSHHRPTHHRTKINLSRLLYSQKVLKYLVDTLSYGY